MPTSSHREMVEAEWRELRTIEAWARWHRKLARPSAEMTKRLPATARA